MQQWKPSPEILGISEGGSTKASKNAKQKQRRKKRKDQQKANLKEEGQELPGEGEDQLPKLQISKNSSKKQQQKKEEEAYESQSEACSSAWLNLFPNIDS